MSESKPPSQANRRTRNASAKTSRIGIIRRCRSLRIPTKEGTMDTRTIEINSSTMIGKQITYRKMTMTRSTQKKTISRTSSYIINSTRKDLLGSRITKRRLRGLKISSPLQRQPSKRPIRLQQAKESHRLCRDKVTNRFNLCTSPKSLKVLLNMLSISNLLSQNLIRFIPPTRTSSLNKR